MGLIELVLAVGVVGISVGLVLVVLRVVPASATPVRPPLRWPLIIAGLVPLALAPIAGIVGSEWLLESPAVTFVVESAGDTAVARGIASIPFAVWAAMPGLCLLAVAIGSSRRRPADAWIVAGFAGVGATAGLILGLWLAQLAVLTAIAPELGGVAAVPGLVDTMSAVALPATAVTLVGALIGAIGPIAALSRRSRRVAFLLSAAAPGLLMWLTAVTTPPDVVSQLLLAAPLGVLWAIALGIGALVGPIRDA